MNNQPEATPDNSHSAMLTHSTKPQRRLCGLLPVLLGLMLALPTKAFCRAHAPVSVLSPTGSDAHAEGAPTADTLFLSTPLPDSVFSHMQGRSYPAGCTLPRADLRLLTLTYYDFDGHRQIGQMVCHRAIAHDLLDIFRELYRQHYPIARIRLIDDYDADDERSMRANNTSCFCYRAVSGSQKLSMHARGLAVDLNPVQNPCVRRRRDGILHIQPATGKPYAHRARTFLYKITHQDLAYRLFTQHGFSWGGNWRTVKDYQHFEKNL